MADKCKHCGKFFSQLTYCMDQDTHTEMKPYTCKYCAKSFSNLPNCKKHERTHTGEKPYTCKHCKRCFSHLSSCTQHERIHTGEKPYTCKYCQKSFHQLSNCTQHEKSHARASSLKQKQHDQCSKSRRDLQESAATLGDNKSCVLFSLSEEVKKIQAKLKVWPVGFVWGNLVVSYVSSNIMMNIWDWSDPCT